MIELCEFRSFLKWNCRCEKVIDGNGIRTIQRLPGHKKLETTKIYTHVKVDT